MAKGSDARKLVLKELQAAALEMMRQRIAKKRKPAEKAPEKKPALSEEELSELVAHVGGG